MLDLSDLPFQAGPIHNTEAVWDRGCGKCNWPNGFLARFRIHGGQNGLGADCLFYLRGTLHYWKPHVSDHHSKISKSYSLHNFTFHRYANVSFVPLELEAFQTPQPRLLAIIVARLLTGIGTGFERLKIVTTNPSQ